MEPERKAWERMEGESLKWYSRFDKFRLMKPWKRSINAVYEEEETENHGKVRTKIAGKWYEIAQKWQWNERADAWDTHCREERDRNIALEEEEISKSEYALKHKRIQALNGLSEQLMEEARNKENMYLIGEKETKFNDGLYGMIDKYFASIAAEKGERVKMTEQKHSGTVDVAGFKELLIQKIQEQKK